MPLVEYRNSDSNSESEDLKIQNEKFNKCKKKKIIKKRFCIEAPSLTDDDSDNEIAKKSKVSKDLLNILPPPRNSIYEPLKEADFVVKSCKVSENFKPSIKNYPQLDQNALKSLTDPAFIPAPEVEPVNNTCRKKHHITYLAQQAREKELEFKNQWADSKYARQLTRQKYGF